MDSFYSQNDENTILQIDQSVESWLTSSKQPQDSVVAINWTKGLRMRM